MSIQLILLRKCRECGLEAHTTEDLELFPKNKLACYGHRNICKKCFNSQLRDPLKYRPARDKYSKKRNPRRIGFLGKRIQLKDNPRTNICTKCGRGYPGELKTQTVIHHEKYETKNILAHTIELCMSCHNRLHVRQRGGKNT